MTDFRATPDAHDAREPLDADALADALDGLQAGEYRLAGDEPRLAAARRLMHAPHPAMRPEASARIEAQLLAAAHNIPTGARQAPPRRRVSWPLAAAAALVLALAGVLVPRLVEPNAAAPTSAPSATLTITPSFTLTLTPTETPTLTATATPSPTETGMPPEATPLAAEEALTPAPAAPGQADGTGIDCANPPPDNAQALGWRERCEGGPSPEMVAPGQGESSPADPPGNSDAGPGRSDSAPGRSDSAPGRSDSAPGNSDTAPGRNK